MNSFVLLLVCSLVAYSRACTSALDCDLHVVHCGSGWHVLCDHGLCTCAQNGIVHDMATLGPNNVCKDRRISCLCGCTQNSECVDGIHTCSEYRPVWRCVIREINNFTRGTCSCHHTE